MSEKDCDHPWHESDLVVTRTCPRCGGDDGAWDEREGVETMGQKPTYDEFPARLSIQDTRLFDDLGGGGQRIYTTAGRGYRKVEYVRGDLVERLADAASRVVANCIDDGDYCSMGKAPAVALERAWNGLTNARTKVFCGVEGCDNEATHTRSGHPTCDAHGTPPGATLARFAKDVVKILEQRSPRHDYDSIGRLVDEAARNLGLK